LKRARCRDTYWVCEEQTIAPGKLRDHLARAVADGKLAQRELVDFLHTQNDLFVDDVRPSPVWNRGTEPLRIGLLRCYRVTANGETTNAE
jgi:hypothetical protein